MPELLNVTAASASYAPLHGPAVRAVDDISFTLAEGEVLGVAGESGCGKSTLAQVLALAARPPLRVESGRMTLRGEEYDLTARTLPRQARGTLIATLPQAAMNSLNPTARVRDLAFDVLRAHQPGIHRKAAWARAASRLEQLGLPTRVLDHYPHQLSGGMKQRVVTVIATLLDPTLLIADEPTSALDVSSQRALVLLLRDLLARRIISGVIFITHDLPLLRELADRVMVMYAGRLAEAGPTRRLIEEPRHPYTRALISSILVPEPALRGQRLSGIPGAPPDLSAPPSGCRFHPRCPAAEDVCRASVPPLLGDAHHSAACWPLAATDGAGRA